MRVIKGIDYPISQTIDLNTIHRFLWHASTAIIHGWKLIRRWSRRHCLLSTLTGCILSSYPIRSSCITHVQIWANWTYFRAYITRLFRNSLRSILRIRFAGYGTTSRCARSVSGISSSSKTWIHATMHGEAWTRIDKGREDKGLSSWIDYRWESIFCL